MASVGYLGLILCVLFHSCVCNEGYEGDGTLCSKKDPCLGLISRRDCSPNVSVVSQSQVPWVLFHLSFVSRHSRSYSVEIKSSLLRGEKITFHTGNLPGCHGIVEDSDSYKLAGFSVGV